MLAIPPICPSFNICPIIQVDYQFRVNDFDTSLSLIFR